MEAQRRLQIDRLAEWAAATSRTMSGRNTDFTPVEVALPGLAPHLHSVALAGIAQALGGPLVPDQQVQIEYAPGRVRVYLEGYGSVESETGSTSESLDG